MPCVALHVVWHSVQRKRVSLHEWRPMVPWPVWPLAGHATLGQHGVVESMRVLRVALGNVPRGVCLDPHVHCKRTIPRLSVELPVPDTSTTTDFFLRQEQTKGVPIRFTVENGSAGC